MVVVPDGLFFNLCLNEGVLGAGLRGNQLIA